MANRFPIILQHHRLPNLAAVHPNASISCSQLLKRTRNLSSYRLTRRLVFGIGVSFWAQFMSMAGKSGTSSFIASARTKGAVEQILQNVEWPEKFPFKEEDFQRFDESSDLVFYESPRFVTHIDDPAIAALTKYYKEVFPPSNTPGVALLDMCSSWVLTEYIVQDLNMNPKLPFDDNTFDVITNVVRIVNNSHDVSVDYLTKPIEVFKEMCRILKPGGKAIMSFSNRCFFTKAISIWTSTGDSDHVMIVGAYFHYAGGFEPPQAVDISPNPSRSDPMYIVHSRKLAAA
ncbi:Methyltransferase type 11 [Cynara cardunculus var. scolymus]|uniref:Methyltransferase type 11 n=1 Tax=Cynara cardunculus var. scolymus TaxID=59895 RepID=A0A103YN50_CYNCS|nr:Methyltransferase type 11 [Cynara cardunculus var. scolymus]